MSENAPLLVVLYDVLGKEYYSKMTLSDTEGNVSFVIETSMPLSKGVYIVKASSDDKLISKKIVVE